jgi:hypothetical protein
VAIGLACALAGCDGAGTARGLQLRLLDPDSLLDSAAVLSLHVYGMEAHCDGAAVVGGDPSGPRSDFAPGQSLMVSVVPGHRVFALWAFAELAETTRIGQGCAEADLVAGEQLTLPITVVAVGGTDMGLDMAPVDAGVDATGPDLRAPPDLARPEPQPDLVTPPDLEPATDLVGPIDLRAPDLVAPPDLAAPPDLTVAEAGPPDLYSALAGDHCPGTSLPPNVVLSGTTRGYLDDGTGSCEPPGSYPDRIYSFTINTPQEIVIDVNAQTLRQAVFVVGGSCAPLGQEYGCAAAAGLSQHLDIPFLPSGTYWIFVDAVGGGDSFTVRWQFLPPVNPG